MKTFRVFSLVSGLGLLIFSPASSAWAAPQVGVVNGASRLTFERKDDRIIIRAFRKTLDDGTVLTAADMADPEEKGNRFLESERSIEESVFREEFDSKLAKLDASKLSEEQKIQLERIRNINALKTDLAEKKSKNEELKGQLTALELEEEAIEQSRQALKERRATLAQAKRDFPKVDHSAEEKALEAQARSLDERSKRREELVRSTEQAIVALDPCMSAAERSLEQSEQALNDLQGVFERMERAHGGVFGLGAPRLQQILTFEVNHDGILFNLLVEMSKFEDPSKSKRPRRDPVARMVGKWKGEAGENLNFAEAREFCRKQGLRLPSTDHFKELFKSGKASEVLSTDGTYWAASTVSSVTAYTIDGKTGDSTQVAGSSPDQKDKKLLVRCIER